MKMEEIVEISNSAIVDANYDGFKIEVDILTDLNKIECACYFYEENEVVLRSGYKNNSRHIFYPKKENSNLDVKVFFRYKYDHALKKSKLFPISIKKKLKYEVLRNFSDSIVLSDCEIINFKPDIIEKYEKEGFQPRNDNTPHKLILPINWLEDPFNDRNWMFQLHAWRMLDAYLNRGNTKDLNYVSKIINDWIAFEKNNESKWFWYDMSTGLRALKICFYLKKCCETGVDHNIEDLEYLFHKHLKHLSNPKELNSGNHGLFQLHGLKSLTYILRSCGSGAHNMSDMKTYANEEMSKLTVSQLGSHGVHTEDSPDYHFFTHKKITNIVNAPWWSDLSEEILRVLELGEHAKPWLVFPNKKCVPIGDSAVGAIIKNLSALEEWPHVQKGNYIGAQVDGYAIVRSLESIPLNQSSFLFFQGSFYSQVHKHADDLSFILQESGVDLLIDSGKYGYQGDKYRKYFLSTRAHNTIEVDGKSTARTKEYAYGSAIKSRPKYISGFWLLRSCVNHKVNQYIHERTIIYKPGEDLYVIDKIINNEKDKTRNISQWWHFDTNTKLTVTSDKVLANIDKYGVIEITSVSSIKGSTFKLYKGYESGDSLIGWVSKSYLKYEPTATLKISTHLDESLTILTRFKIKKNLADESVLNLKNEEIITKDINLSIYLNS